MKYICLVCGKESQREEVKRTEEFDVKGEKITVESVYLKCNKCGTEFEDLNSSYDPYNIAYEEYRNRKGMVHPTQIIEFRKKYGLTQKELSDLLGFGDVTLSRYENGALQDEVHDKLLRLAMEPANLIELLKQKKNVFENSKFLNLIDRLKVEIALSDLIKKIQIDSEPNINNGFKTFDFQKLTNVVRFFTFKNDVYKTKLLKLLFYVDFKYFKENRSSIMGLKYAHCPFGPAPDNFNYLLGSLINVDPAFQVNEGVNEGEVFTSLEQPDLSIFTRAEIDTITSVDNFFKKYMATQIKDFSHQEKAYSETHDGEIISYDYAKDLQI